MRCLRAVVLDANRSHADYLRNRRRYVSILPLMRSTQLFHVAQENLKAVPLTVTLATLLEPSRPIRRVLLPARGLP